MTFISSAIYGCPLFSGIEEKELDGMLGCLDAKTTNFSKGGYILRAGSTVADGFGDCFYYPGRFLGKPQYLVFHRARAMFWGDVCLRPGRCLKCQCGCTI